MTAGGITFTYAAPAGANNPNVESTTGGAASTPATTLGTSAVLTIVHGANTTTYTTGTTAAGTTLQSLVTAINTNASVAGSGTIATTGVAVAGGSGAGLSAAIVNGQLQVTDNNGNNNLVVSGEAAVITTTTGVAQSTAPTVQNLINAINADTTVGAKAALVGGQLQITDPLNRADLAVTTTDAVLGAPVQGAPTSFTNPTTAAAATINNNELASNIGTTGTPVTAATALTNGGVTQFTAGGKTFTFTANATNGLTVGALIAAINNPNDAAGLHAYLGTAGSGTTTQLIVTDPNNNNDVAVGAANTETLLGTFSNPSTTGSTTTNIFLSDSTGIGSSQIGVTIGGLSTASITNGSGGGAVNLAVTDLDTQGDAQTALTLIGSAIANVASVRGTLGASVNRLTAASNVINSQVQNLTAAENTISAADIPTAVANLTKYSILEQTGISALAQANQQQQLVLKLLQ